MSQPTRTLPRVLIVDDDPVAASSLADFLEESGYRTRSALSAEDARRILDQHAHDAPHAPDASPIGIVLSDVSMPGMGGMELIRIIAKHHPSVATIMLSGYGTIESAVQAVRAGAIDYLTKPVVDAELKLALERAARHHLLAAENRQLKERLNDKFGLERIVGNDARMQRIFSLIEAVAPSKTTVLMTGQSGVGKSLIAQAIHQRSPRRDKPFVQLSCGSIPETLLESELFGHVKGAFTGAYADKAGRFLAADGGTIFLDEINSASPAMQLKLLRVLQERAFEPVGSTQTIEVDVRVVLATNKPLEELVSRGEFRQDLYFRINVVSIELPPLRQRTSDIPLLATHFLAKHAAAINRTFAGFSQDALAALLRYDYPGNVRELENIVERAVVLSTSPTIGLDALPTHVVENASPLAPGAFRLVGSTSSNSDDAPWTPTPLEAALREPEKRILLRALAANDWNRQKTADDLHINRTTLYKKMKLLGIDGADDRAAG